MSKGLCYNLKVAKVKANRKFNGVAAKVTAPIIAAAAAMGIAPTFCEIDINSTFQNTLKTIFNILTFGGIVLIGAGVIMLVKAFVEASQGQSQPGAVGKAVAMIIGGVALAAAKAIVKAVLGGQDPTTYTYVEG